VPTTMASQNALAAAAVAASIDSLPPTGSAAADGPPQLAAVQDSAADVHAALLRVYTREQLKEICKAADVPVCGVKLSLAKRLVSDVTAQNLCNIIPNLQASSSGLFPSSPVFLSNNCLHVLPTRASVAGSAGGAPAQPPFDLDEYARMVHVLSESSVQDALSAHKNHRSRSELEAPPPDPWISHVGKLYNDNDYAPDAVANAPLSILMAVPTVLPRERPPAFLKVKWADLRRIFCVAYKWYTKSGNNQPAIGQQVREFEDCIPDDVSPLLRQATEYAWCVFQINPDLLDKWPRNLPDDAAFEAGGGGGSGSDRTSPARGRKRAAPAHEQVLDGIDRRLEAILGDNKNEAQQNADQLDTLTKVAKQMDGLSPSLKSTKLLHQIWKQQATTLLKTSGAPVDETDEDVEEYWGATET